MLGHQLDRIAERNRLARDFTLHEPRPRAPRGDRLPSRSTAPTSATTGATVRARATAATSSRAVAEAKRRNPTVERVDLRLRPRRAPARAIRTAAAPRSAPRGADFAMKLPADDRAGHGQGRRGHRLLRLQPPGLAQRGRRRPRRASGEPVAAFHARNERAARALAARRCWPPRPTTPSAARTCARASTCCRRCRASGPPRCAAGAGSPAAQAADRRPAPRPTATTSTCSTRPSSAPGPRGTKPRPLETVTVAARRLHGEGHQGGQGAHELGQPEPARTTRRWAASSRGLLAAGRPASSPRSGPSSSWWRPTGAVNSLAQTLLKLTVPGVPDFYQGTELWDFSLVDPDNRRAGRLPRDGRRCWRPCAPASRPTRPRGPTPRRSAPSCSPTGRTAA